MGKKGFFVTLVVILILIFLLFPASTGRENILIPERIIDLEKTSSNIRPGETGDISFSLGDYFGYFTEKLDITFLDKKDYKVSISDDVFINYPKISQILDIQNRDGARRSKIETTGYPIIQDDCVVVISDSFISLYNLEGNLRWKKEILSIITSLSISEDHVLIAYLDGYCELMSISGETVFSYRPGGSRIEAVYSAAISSDSQYISIIAGLDPQRFILLQDRKGEYKPVYHFELDEEFRRSLKMYFSEDDSRIFFENSQGINIFNLDLKTLTVAGDSGRMENIYMDEAGDFYTAMLTDQNGGSLKIFTLDNRIVLDKRFDGGTLFFKKNNNRVYVGADKFLMSLHMVNR